MSVITIAWSAVAAIGLSFFAIQLALWRIDRNKPDALLAATMALAASSGATCELAMAKASSIEAFQLPLLVNNFFVFMLVVPMVWFVRLRLGAGPRWLAWTITGIWLFCLVVNFGMPGDLTFSSIEQLDTLRTFWGEAYSVPVGTANPFRFLSEIASILIIVFVAWASIAASRAGNLAQALRIGGPVLIFIVTAAVHTVLVDLGIVKTPYMISWAFMAIAIALGLELIRGAAASARLALDLQTSEARWRVLLENISLGVIGLSTDGRVTFANRALLTLLGRDQHEILDRPLSKFVPPALRAELDSRIETARKRGPRSRAEYPLLDAEGNRRDIVWSIVGVRNGSNEITGFVALCDDVTDTRRTERDLQDTRRAIEKLDRSAALSEVTAGIAHELNQPLAAILSNAQAGRHLLRKDPADVGSVLEILDDIVADDKRARDIITGIRALLSPQVGSMYPVAFADIAEDIQRILSSELLAREIALVIHDTHALPHVHANKVQIEQVLLNLVLNAVRALQEAETRMPRIEIRARVRGDRLHVFVSDNGPGIDPEIRERILEPGVTTRQDGLGMGLTISGRIIENHGGRIGIVSRPDRGTVFRFTLPLADAETCGDE